MSGPLEGVRLVELGAWVAGPGAGGILADWGADVVKIEPPAGDPARNFGRMLGGDLPVNPVFELDNRGKRSIALDLSTEEGLDVAHRLVAGADVLLTNLRPAALSRVGLGPDQVRARHPGLVYALITGYGTEGPDAERGAYDIGAFWAALRHRGVPARARGTIAVPTRRHGRPQRGHDGSGHGERGSRRASPHRTGAGGHDLAAAPGRVHHRLRRERCAHVGPQPRHRHRETMYSPTLNNYTAGDGRSFWIVGLEGDRHWPALARAVGHPEWIDDERFADARARGRHAAELIGLLDEIFSTRPLNEWRATFDADPEMFWSPVNTVDDVVADEQFHAAGSVVQVPDEQGSLPMLATPADFGGRPPQPRFRAPLLGEHTRELLAELGLDEPSVDALLAAGAAVDGRPDGRSAGQQDDQKL